MAHRFEFCVSKHSQSKSCKENNSVKKTDLAKP